MGAAPVGYIMELIDSMRGSRRGTGSRSSRMSGHRETADESKVNHRTSKESGHRANMSGQRETADESGASDDERTPLFERYDTAHLTRSLSDRQLRQRRRARAALTDLRQLHLGDFGAGANGAADRFATGGATGGATGDTTGRDSAGGGPETNPTGALAPRIVSSGDATAAGDGAGSEPVGASTPTYGGPTAPPLPVTVGVAVGVGAVLAAAGAGWWAAPAACLVTAALLAAIARGESR